MNSFDTAKETLAKWRSNEAAKGLFAACYTPHALKALALGRAEAKRLNHNFEGTEHVLLGLIRLGEGVAVTVLKRMGLDLANVRAQVENLVGEGAERKLDLIPYTLQTERVLDVAKMQAKELYHTFVGTEHLLLGLLSETEGVAAQVLLQLNINVVQVRTEILKELDPNFRADDA